MLLSRSIIELGFGSLRLGATNCGMGDEGHRVAK
jgi:hypothetical protein